MFFKNKTIRKRVMQTMESRISEAQKNYDAQCEAFDRELEDQISNLKAENVSKKTECANQCVDGVLKF